MWQSVIALKNKYSLIFYFFFSILLHIIILLAVGFILKKNMLADNNTLDWKYITVHKKPTEINLKFRQREVEIKEDDIVEIIKREKKRKKIIQKEIKPTFIPLEFKQSYIDLVYEKLEENKFYPEIERVRGHEGEIFVKFTIEKNGNIKNFAIVKECPYKYLNTAAVETVKSSVPFPPLPDEMNEMNILITIVYKLN